MDIQQLANSVGGIFLIVFLLWQVIEKVCGNMDWYIKRKTAKIEKERNEREKEMEEVTERIIKKAIPPILEEMKEKNSQQDERLNRLTKTSNDMLRNSMVKIYYSYLPYKKILHYDKEVLIKLHNDYEIQGGNTFIEELWNEIKTWTVVKNVEDLKK